MKIKSKKAYEEKVLNSNIKEIVRVKGKKEEAAGFNQTLLSFLMAEPSSKKPKRKKKEKEKEKKDHKAV